MPLIHIMVLLESSYMCTVLETALYFTAPPCPVFCIALNIPNHLFPTRKCTCRWCNHFSLNERHNIDELLHFYRTQVSGVQSSEYWWTPTFFCNTLAIGGGCIIRSGPRFVICIAASQCLHGSSNHWFPSTSVKSFWSTQYSEKQKSVDWFRSTFIK